MAELVDIIDDNGEVIETVTRAEAQAKGGKMRYVHVFIFNDAGEVLLQQRCEHRARPNLIDPSVAGHVSSGDSYEKTALRETEEEIGVQLNNLKFIGESSDYFGRCAVFTAKYNGPFTPDADEVKDLHWVSIEQLEFIIAKLPFMAIDGMQATIPMLLEHLRNNG